MRDFERFSIFELNDWPKNFLEYKNRFLQNRVK